MSSWCRAESGPHKEQEQEHTHTIESIKPSLPLLRLIGCSGGRDIVTPLYVISSLTSSPPSSSAAEINQDRQTFLFQSLKTIKSFRTELMNEKLNKCLTSWNSCYTFNVKWFVWHTAALRCSYKCEYQQWWHHDGSCESQFESNIKNTTNKATNQRRSG